MEIRPCFSSVWRRRLKFSTLPSAVNLDGNKNVDNPSFRVVLLVLFNLVLQYQPTCCTTKLGAYVPSAALTGPL